MSIAFPLAPEFREEGKNNNYTTGHCVTLSHLHLRALSELRTIISPILQIRKPRFREVSKLGRDGWGSKTALSLENSSC